MLKSNDPCWCGSGKKYKRCHRADSALVHPGTLSPWREVPADIARPDYAESGEPRRWPEPLVKSPEVIERMRRAGRAAAEILAEAGRAVAPGVTTDEIDAVVHEATIAHGGYPSPLNYRGFPKSVCTSVNEVICHGIPDDRALRDGEIVNIDVTIFLDGVHGDTNATFLVGDVDPVSRRLVRVTRECLDAGIDAVRPGRPISDIGKAIEAHAHGAGFEVVRAFIGHGIGELFHADLQIPHYYEPRATTEMEPGMTFTIEPMIAIGTWKHEIWDDGWTAVTADLSRTAQFEHTVLVTPDGVERLTVVEDTGVGGGGGPPPPPPPPAGGGRTPGRRPRRRPPRHRPGLGRLIRHPARRPMRHRRFDVAAVRLDGEDVRLRYADLVVADPEGTDQLQWECIVVPLAFDRLATGAYAVAVDTLDGRTLAGDAILVRSVNGTHVFRGAGPLAGLEADELT